MKEESDITFDRIFLRGLIGLGESFDLFFLPPPPPNMYNYKHNRICTDIYAYPIMSVHVYRGGGVRKIDRMVP